MIMKEKQLSPTKESRFLKLLSKKAILTLFFSLSEDQACLQHTYPHNQIGLINILYTLLQRKCTLTSPSSSGDPGSLTSTPGHVKFVKLSRPFDKIKMTRGQGQWPRDLIKLGWFSCALFLEKSVDILIHLLYILQVNCRYHSVRDPDLLSRLWFCSIKLPVSRDQHQRKMSFPSKLVP